MVRGAFFSHPHIYKVKRQSNCWTVEKVPYKLEDWKTTAMGFHF